MLWDPSKDKKMIDEIGECYLKAIEVIEQKGWCQGQPINAKGEVCVAGAIQMATHQSLELQGHALNLLHETLGTMISKWNDAPERTESEVIAKLKEVAYAKRS